MHNLKGNLANHLGIWDEDQHVQQAYQAQLNCKQQKPVETLQQYEAEVVR